LIVKSAKLFACFIELFSILTVYGKGLPACFVFLLSYLSLLSPSLALSVAVVLLYLSHARFSNNKTR